MFKKRNLDQRPRYFIDSRQNVTEFLDRIEICQIKVRCQGYSLIFLTFEWKFLFHRNYHVAGCLLASKWRYKKLEPDVLDWNILFISKNATICNREDWVNLLTLLLSNNDQNKAYLSALENENLKVRTWVQVKCNVSKTKNR